MIENINNIVTKTLFLAGDLAQFDGGFFDKFDIIVISCCSFNNKVLKLSSNGILLNLLISD